MPKTHPADEPRPGEPRPTPGGAPKPAADSQAAQAAQAALAAELEVEETIDVRPAPRD